MKIKTNLLKDARDEWLIQTIATLNEINPVVDRILEDESVAGVVMTNKEGNPIFTNINLMTANMYGTAIAQLGNMAIFGICEIKGLKGALLECQRWDYRNITLKNCLLERSFIELYEKTLNDDIDFTDYFDPFDELLVIRLKTKKTEVLTVPHKEFNIAVIQNTKAIKSNKETYQTKPKI